MKRLSNAIISILIWNFGATLYFMLEVVFKTLTGKPESISWTMLVLAFILCIPVERCGKELPWSMPLYLQALICAIFTTIAELFSGIILNIALGLNIWDYSNMWGNVLGQICPQFFILWWFLCFIFIPVFDFLRFLIDKDSGDFPRYKII